MVSKPVENGSLDPVSRHVWGLRLRLRYAEARGNAFQDMFSDVMNASRGTDFVQVRPWGSDGDRKCDGYLLSTKTLFQCYAPNEMTASDAITKIEADLAGAKVAWANHLSEWIFAHNSRQGLPPHALEALLAARVANPGLVVEHWGLDELEDEVFSMDAMKIESLLGPAFGLGDLLAVGVADLQPVLDQIALLPAAPLADLTPPPADKLARNMLSADAAGLLQQGRTRSNLVGDYLARVSDPTLRDRIAASFSAEYRRLRDLGHSPDRILQELDVYAGGPAVSPPTRHAAVLAVLAYFFEECDIFEREPAVPS